MSTSRSLKYFIALILLFSSGCGLVYDNVSHYVLSVNVATVYPINGANWNDYVTWTNKGGTNTAFNQPDLPCAGTELGYYTCIHGGEKKVVTLPGISNCSSLTAQDVLGAFDWICISTNGWTRFYSRGLKSGKGLKDLVSSSGFLPNMIFIYSDGNIFAQSPISLWWTNTVTPLPINNLATSLPLALTQSGTIYTLSQNQTTSGYDVFNTPKVAIVTLNGSVLSYSGYATPWCDTTTGNINLVGGTDYALVCGGSSNFLWIEMNISGTSSGHATSSLIETLNQSFTRVRNTNSTLAGGNGLALSGAVNSSLIDGSNFFKNTGDGIVIVSGCNYDTFFNDTVSQNQNGLTIFNASNYTVAENVRAFGNSAQGVQVITSNHGAVPDRNETLVNTIAGASQGNGIILSSFDGGVGLLGIDILNTSSYQSGTMGVYPQNVQGFNIVNTVGIKSGSTAVQAENSSNGVMENTVAADANTGVAFVGASDTQVLGNLWLFGNTTNCNGGGATFLSTAGPCLYGPGLTTSPTTTSDPTASYIGALGASDLANPTVQTAGVATFATISDWIDFSSIYRSWGASPGNGYCSVGNCQIEDWRLNKSDNFLLNLFGGFPFNQACPSSIDPTIATNIMTDQQTVPHTFLIHATEVMDPALNPAGNYNGLCESGEACIYSPNMGGYQGEGDYTQQVCVFKNGNGFVGNVMYGYPTNGN
jgi:hypothetical protein